MGKKLGKITYGLIRKLYPKPTSYGEEYRMIEDGEYCVGGALLMTLEGDGSPTKFEEEIRFPSSGMYIGEGLMKVNPKLSEKDAVSFGRAILNYNDDSHFKRAWDVMKRAFRFKSKVSEE